MIPPPPSCSMGGRSWRMSCHRKTRSTGPTAVWFLAGVAPTCSYLPLSMVPRQGESVDPGDGGRDASGSRGSLLVGLRQGLAFGHSVVAPTTAHLLAIQLEQEVISPYCLLASGAYAVYREHFQLSLLGVRGMMPRRVLTKSLR
jgi:hypothetical protein